MSKHDTDLVCTCTEIEAAFYHDTDCDLWLDPDFQWGSKYWTGSELAELPVDVNMNDVATLRDWQTMAETEGTDVRDPLDELFDEWDITEAEVISQWEEDKKAVGGKALAELPGTTVKNENTYGTGSSWSGYASAGTYMQKCRHYGVTVTLPDGTPIICSSQHDRKPDDDHPDFGCYMASSWHPQWAAYLLNWRDYGLPEIPTDQLLWMVDHLLEYARAGMKVEIGCIGGHGRTGSLLAILAMRASNLSAEDAAWFVWENYCTEAIEGKKQLWFLQVVQAHLRGEEPPEMPQEPCMMHEHRKMWEEGVLCKRAVCHAIGSASDKKFDTAWEEDFDYFMQPKKVTTWAKGVRTERLEQPNVHKNWLGDTGPGTLIVL